MKNSNTVPAVEKALEVIELLCSAGRPLTQQEICKGVDVTASTGYRIVQSMIAHNWLKRNQNNTYTLTIGICGMLLKAQQNIFLFSSAQRILDDLANAARLACKLSIRQGNEQVTVLRAESPEPFAVAGKKGARFPVIEGSAGAALLADAGADELQELLDNTTLDIAEKQDSALLFDRVAEIRMKGWIFNRGNSRWRVDALSLPVRDSRGSTAAALTLLGLQDDFNESKLPGLVRAAQAAVRKIETEL